METQTTTVTREKANNLFAGNEYELENGFGVTYLGFSPKYGHYIQYSDGKIEHVPHKSDFYFITKP